jgi:hypothetical protein
MLDHLEIRDEIASASEHWRSKMPDNVKAAIENCNADLYNGPLYFNKDGDECTCFDDGAVRFDFTKGLATIREFTDTIEDVKMSDYVGEDDDGEPIYETVNIDDSASQIAKSLCGAELYKTL